MSTHCKSDGSAPVKQSQGKYHKNVWLLLLILQMRRCASVVPTPKERTFPLSSAEQSATAVARLRGWRIFRSPLGNLSPQCSIDFSLCLHVASLRITTQTKVYATSSCYFFGSDGLNSTRLGNARGSISTRLITTEATSSGKSFHVVAGSCSPLRPKLVFTEPGIT